MLYINIININYTYVIYFIHVMGNILNRTHFEVPEETLAKRLVRLFAVWANLHAANFGDRSKRLRKKISVQIFHQTFNYIQIKPNTTIRH